MADSYKMDWTAKPSTESLIFAHDMLVALSRDETPIRLPDHDKTFLSIFCGVLCWVLGHEEGQSFAVLMSGLEKAVHLAGGRFVRQRGAHSGPDAGRPTPN